MKTILFYICICTATITYAQHGTINGKIMDAELKNRPLLLAEVSIKELGIKAHTNSNGVFLFDNVTYGTYTLICRFLGYRTVELKTEVKAISNTPILIALEASNLSLDDLALVLASSANENSKINTN